MGSAHSKVVIRSLGLHGSNSIHQSSSPWNPTRPRCNFAEAGQGNRVVSTTIVVSDWLVGTGWSGEDETGRRRRETKVVVVARETSSLPSQHNVFWLDRYCIEARDCDC